MKAAEVAKLRREEKRRAYRLKAILDSVYDGIIAVDAEGRLEIVNRAGREDAGHRCCACHRLQGDISGSQ